MNPVEAEIDICDTLSGSKAVLPLAGFKRSQELLFVLWEVDEVLEREQGDQDSEDLESAPIFRRTTYTLEKENPTPTLETGNALHLTNAVCEGSTESSCQCGTSEEDSLHVRLAFERDQDLPREGSSRYGCTSRREEG